MGGEAGNFTGTLIAGRYVLTDVVGVGGMAEVWRARDPHLGRDVAVKLLVPSRAVHGMDWSELVERFRQEAQLVARLDSPHIVMIHDYGKADIEGQRCAYLVMTLVRGQTLQELIDNEGRISMVRALRYSEQICRALSVAHAAGVVHRDIKPANAMVTEDGHVRVLDFGIAHLAEESIAGLELSTADDMPFGSVLYMAPERFRNDDGGPPVDLYAVGCVLYELLTSQPPFVGPSAGVMYNHLHDQPMRPSQIRAGIPPAVDELVLTLMAKDPAERPDSAQEVAERLAQLAIEVQQGAGAPRADPAPEPAPSGRPRPRPRPGRPAPSSERGPEPGSGAGMAVESSRRSPRRPAPARPAPPTPAATPARPAPPTPARPAPPIPATARTQAAGTGGDTRRAAGIHQRHA